MVPSFEIRLDDGDGVYEPDAEDGAPVATLDATKGYATYQPPESGDYWVKEVSPPSGLATAKAELVAYDATDVRNCAVANGHKKCQVDEDGSGGFVIAVVSDAPVGHPLPPQTDTVTPAGPVRQRPLAGLPGPGRHRRDRRLPRPSRPTASRRPLTSRGP